jgi:hypothetical protein
MPSRKKAQGQARKAEKEKQAREQARAQQRASCIHFTPPENATQDDLDAANSLLNEHIEILREYIVAVREGNKDPTTKKLALAHATFIKYFLFNDVRKQVFRDFVIARGTFVCVVEAGKKDLAKEISMPFAWPFVSLISMIEVLDKHQGSFDAHHVSEYMKQLSTPLLCPRETIRFFHRRNSCDCLHEIYYKLKDATNRTFLCANCKRAVDVKKTFHCKCEIAKYCSSKCALDQWPDHKDDCKSIRDEWYAV